MEILHLAFIQKLHIFTFKVKNKVTGEVCMMCVILWSLSCLDGTIGWLALVAGIFLHICWVLFCAAHASGLETFIAFPSDRLCESRSQPSSIRKDVKYRARRIKIEQRETERWSVTRKAAGRTEEDVKPRDTACSEWKMTSGQINAK